jgi:hypothetical protein
MKIFVDSLPTGAFLIVLAAWTIGTFVGALVASVIARDKPLLHSGIVGAVMLLATIMNLMTIPHPTWMAASGLALIVAMTVLASRIAQSVDER